LKIKGVIETGVGEGSFFTGLEWVVEQFEEEMGFKPFPGTLNVRVLKEEVPEMDAFFSSKDFELIPEDPQFCSAWLKRVWIKGILGAAVFPSEDVHIHKKEVIEVMSSCHLKDTLHLKDGDEIELEDNTK